MKVEVQRGSLNDAKTEATVIFTTTKSSKSEKNQLQVKGLSKKTAEKVQQAFDDNIFASTQGETLFFRDADSEGAKHLLFVGLGNLEKLTLESVRRGCASAFKALKNQKVQKVQISVDSIVDHFKKHVEELGQAISEGLYLANYSFTELKTKKKDKELRPQTISLVIGTAGQEKPFSSGVEAGEKLSECINFARDLGNYPGNLMTPTILANETQKAAKGTALKVSVWDKARIKKEKMGSFYGVSTGSDQEPRFILMEYKGAPSNKKPICFVGKGLTFDCGGISIKPSAQMEEMKFDMCGGANVIATMLAIAKLKLKVNAIGFVPSTENMPGPSATKPGDIHTARNGKTIEVNNTDAEGRLILADALVYASEQKPAFIVDAATLTGAIKIALGDTHTGFFSRSEGLTEKIQQAAKASGEWVWEMPLVDEHHKDMKGVYADLSNISYVGGAGSAKGAAFLAEFVDSEIPWAHFDIAATAWHVGNRVAYHPDKGASGVMVKTFVELAKQHKS